MNSKTSAASLKPADAATRAKADEAYGRLPLNFEINRGQADPSIKFFSRGSNYSLSLAPTEATLRLRGASATQPATVRIKPVNANPSPKIEGVDQLPGRSNYLIGSDRRRWRTNIPNYTRARYDELWPGVDAVFYGNQRNLEYDFIVKPGADPSVIELKFDGAERISIDGDGDLLLNTAAGEIRQLKPIIYQEAQGSRREVIGGYVLKGERRIGFRVAEYDRRLPLVIDPAVRIYGSYLGGTGAESGSAVAVDSEGAAYVTGSTASSDFPVIGALQGQPGGSDDAFVVKINPSGTAIVYATYLGGRSIDKGASIAVDAEGNIYVSGTTSSDNFPLANAIQRNFGGAEDGFIAKLNASGSAFIYSTYLGGSSPDDAADLAVDATGNVYVTGSTLSINFPLVNAFQTSPSNRNAYVAKLKADGSAFVYSTYLGGASEDWGKAIAIDKGGGAYVTGRTQSRDFPTTEGAFQRVLGSSDTVYVTKLNADGSSPVYSTFIGEGMVEDIAVDDEGNAYLTGYAPVGVFFPTTPGARTDGTGFFTKLNASGAALSSSTRFALSPGFSSTGFVQTSGRKIALDGVGRAFVCGNEIILPLPPTEKTIRRNFVIKISGASEVVAAWDDGGDNNGLAIGSKGSIYVTGFVRDGDSAPTTINAFQPQRKDAVEAFILRFYWIGSANAVSAANYRQPLGGESIAAIFGSDLTQTTQAAASIPVPTELAGATVKIRYNNGEESLAPLLYASPSQINCIIPPIPTGVPAQSAATMTVMRGDEDVATATIPLATVAPGVFSIDGSGSGLVAGYIQRHKPDGSFTLEAIYRFDPAQNKFVAEPIDLGSETDRVFLVIFGTGWRFRSSETSAQVKIGGVDVPVPYVGLQPSFPGLDQINVELIRTLAGKSEVDLEVTVDGKKANTTRVAMK